MLKNRYLFLFFFTAFSIKKALKVIISKGCLLSSQLVITYIAITWATLYFFLNIGLMKIGVWFIMKHTTGLCSCRAWWLLAPNLCSWATRKSQIFHTNHMLGTLVLQFQSTGLPSIFSLVPYLVSGLQNHHFSCLRTLPTQHDSIVFNSFYENCKHIKALG